MESPSSFGALAGFGPGAAVFGDDVLSHSLENQ
jgi:hypothetical protein